MKKITLTIAAFILIAVSNQTMAQKQVVKKEIKKEVSIEEKNGVKILTIATTDENGVTKKEVFKGAEADKKIAELKKEESGTTKTVVISDDGTKHMKVEKKVVKTKEVEKKD